MFLNKLTIFYVRSGIIRLQRQWVADTSDKYLRSRYSTVLDVNKYKVHHFCCICHILHIMTNFTIEHQLFVDGSKNNCRKHSWLRIQQVKYYLKLN